MQSCLRILLWCRSASPCFGPLEVATPHVPRSLMQEINFWHSSSLRAPSIVQQSRFVGLSHHLRLRDFFLLNFKTKEKGSRSRSCCEVWRPPCFLPLLSAFFFFFVMALRTQARRGDDTSIYYYHKALPLIQSFPFLSIFLSSV